MKIDSKILSISYLFIGIIIGSNNFAMSDSALQKIGVVDVGAVISTSSQVKELKKEHEKKEEELSKWLTKVNAEIKSQKNDNTKQKLLKKYNDELNLKKETNIREYNEKLSAVDKKISDTISQYSKANGYYVVISKTSILYGGDNITEEIEKALNKNSL